MPLARDAKQHCSRDCRERALSFQGCVYLRIFQSTNVALNICNGCVGTFALSLCPSLPGIYIELLLHFCLSVANAGRLSGRLDCQEPVILVFPGGGLQIIKATFQQGLILLLEAIWAEGKLVLDFFKQVLLVRQYEGACSAVMNQGTAIYH